MEEISKRLERINFLAKKAKTEGLTDDEILERERLRKEYLSDFRKKMRSRIESISFVDENGNITPVKRKDQ